MVNEKKNKLIDKSLICVHIKCISIQLASRNIGLNLLIWCEVK